MKKERFKNIGTDIFHYGEWWCSAGGEHCADVIATALNEIMDENEQLKTLIKNISDQRDEFHRGVRENANRIGKLKKENEQLKSDNRLLYSRNTDLKRKNELYDAENEQLKSENKILKEENEQLYELLNFANTLIVFKSSESCQAEWEKRLKELKSE